MRLKRKKREPTHKGVLLQNELAGRTVRVYHSGFKGSFTATNDRVVINGRDYTDALLRQGWIDLDDD